MRILRAAIVVLVAGSLLVACGSGDDDATTTTTTTIAPTTTTAAETPDTVGCDLVDTGAVEAALDVEIVDTTTSFGVSIGSGFDLTTQGCSIETAAGDEYGVALAVGEDGSPDTDVWDAIVSAAEEAPDPGLTAIPDDVADEVVTTPDRIVLLVDGSTYVVEFGPFGDDPTDEDRARLADVAGSLAESAPADLDALCEEAERLVDEVFGGAEAGSQGGGGGVHDGVEYEYETCDVETDGGLEIELAIGGAAAFDGLADTPGPGSGPAPTEVEDLGDDAYQWPDGLDEPRLLVLDGERVLVSTATPADDGEIDEDDLVTLAETVL
ncbi:MAG: hypothetical protein U5R31_06715 [Acidimicrobiia bacterium]|nr:hypothetical protein [Acidimicrobiia bacterium]